MEGAALGGFDGGVEAAVTAQHDDFGLGPIALDGGKEVEAVGVGQAQVEEHDIGLGSVEGALEARAIDGFEHLVVAALKRFGQEVPEFLLIVNQQNFMLHTTVLRTRTQAWTKLLKMSRCSACCGNNRSGWNCTASNHGSIECAPGANSIPSIIPSILTALARKGLAIFPTAWWWVLFTPSRALPIISARCEPGFNSASW